MQWLIDLIIETIGIPPVFIHRGDPADYDFKLVDLTTDNAWHELDLSGIVPEGASAVHLEVGLSSNTVSSFIRFRHTSQTQLFNSSMSKTQVAAVSTYHNVIQALDADRKIDYFASAIGWLYIRITVRGWWL